MIKVNYNLALYKATISHRLWIWKNKNKKPNYLNKKIF